MMFGAIVLAAATGFESLSWRSVGPAVSGGRIAAVAGTPQNDQLYYIGSAGGGVWKSENGGITWSPVFDKEKAPAIGAVAIDPQHQDVVWVGTGESNPRNDVSYGNGVYKTTDGGKTWKSAGLQATRHIARIAVDPRNGSHVVVAALGDPFRDSPDRGIYVTWDGGKSWQHSLYVGPASGASDLAMNPKNPNVLYTGIWQFRRKPWTFTSGGPDDGLYKSTDGGKTWSKLTGHGLPEGMTGRIGLAIAPSDPRRIYALIEAKGGILWRSDDDGASWKMISSDTLVDQRPFYFSHIDVDPSNPNHVYAVSEMLAESKNGGKKFEEIAKDVHVDYHAMWIAPNDAKRMMTGEDGGFGLTTDGGKNWTFSRNLAIGQQYHVGLSDENPYYLCVALQDNNGFCGPSNSLDNQGILNKHWINVIGGDGEWTVPDPIDPNYIWADLEDGVLTLFNRTTHQSRFISPYTAFPGSFLGPFDASKAKYRFNWDSPIAFAPWDGHIAWFGGNAIFQSTDRGEHWTTISPDLTRNLKEHQVPSGGPLAKDVSGAEYSDTILDIEGSPLTKGEIWVGTDDGLVQLSRDGGTTWQAVTPAGAPQFARFETVAPSPLVAGTAYATADDHYLGNYAPLAYVTHDYGKNWALITGGFPHDQFVRTIRPDLHNANLVYAGLEQGLWLSFDGGMHWQPFENKLPAVAIYDIRPQATFNDLVVATHGRAAWIMDDITPIQQLSDAQHAGVMLFPARTAYMYHTHSNDEGAYTDFAGANPPNGAIVNFYQSQKQKAAPAVQIVDASGKVVRTISGTHKVKDKDVPFVSNAVGVNRVVWDFHEDGPVQWMGAAREEYRGPKTGAFVVPGTYTIRMDLGGKTLSQQVVVKPDPRDKWTQADYEAGYAFAKKYVTTYSKIDTVLNNLDAIAKSLKKAPQNAQVTAALAQRQAVFAAFTADYHNDEDSIQRAGSLRESIPRTGFGGQQPPTAAQLDYASRFDEAYAAAMEQYNAFVTSLGPLEKNGIKIDGATPVSP